LNRTQPPTLREDAALAATEASNITLLLARAAQGDAASREAVVPLLYERLRQLARRSRRHERRFDTLNTTALVHEVYLDVFGSALPSFPDRQAFFGYVARAMQNLLTDRARHHLARKRGGGAVSEALDEWQLRDEDSALQLAALDRAISLLQADQPRAAEVMRLKFFVGLSEQEVAELLDVDVRTVRRDWQKARAYVLMQMAEPST
jgi:RNA polymerase sigma factor (TIGR02999 family)